MSSVGKWSGSATPPATIDSANAAAFWPCSNSPCRIVVSGGPELADELVAYCQERMGRYKCPRSVDFTDTMPRDPNGKLYKRRLRDPYWEHSGRDL